MKAPDSTLVRRKVMSYEACSLFIVAHRYPVAGGRSLVPGLPHLKKTNPNQLNPTQRLTQPQTELMRKNQR